MAAGLHVELRVELFAMSAVQAGEVEQKNISQDIIIHTETDILYVPVTANILWKPWKLFTFEEIICFLALVFQRKSLCNFSY